MTMRTKNKTTRETKKHHIKIQSHKNCGSAAAQDITHEGA